MQKGYYTVENSKLWDKRVTQAKANGYVWATDFPGHEPSFHEAERFYHGNSKLLLYLYHNDITDRDEMRYTTKTIEKSYGKNVLEIL